MLTEIRLDELKPSPTNPRKTFDPVKLEELARSIGDVGVLEPILVRKYPALNPAGANPNNGFPTYEIVAGERRYRAAVIARTTANGNGTHRDTVPCIVRELTDVQVLEIQTIENLQRDDLHPLEEAEGYARLMKEASYDVAQIAARIGKSGKYVYDRIKLLQLVPEGRKLFLDGEITAGHAILLARLSSEDQQRLIGDEVAYDFGHRSLFQPEQLGEQEGLDLDDPRKPISVRELQALIDRTVRFRPDQVDLPNLFPETAAALAAAAEEELKVVKITREYQVPSEARDESERTYGSQSWKRADGQPEADFYSNKPAPSKECEHSVMGVVVAGPGRGQAFRVCVAKKKCGVHWAEEIKQAAQRAQGGTSTGSSSANGQSQHQKWEQERQQREAERKRWEKARPKLLEALAESLKKTKPLELIDDLVTSIRGHGGPAPKQLGRGQTLEDAVRYLAFLELSTQVTQSWEPSQQVPKVLKPYGIDARKIVNEVAPKPKPEKPEAKKAKPSGEGTGARARRRAKKKPQTSAEA